MSEAGLNNGQRKILLTDRCISFTVQQKLVLNYTLTKSQYLAWGFGFDYRVGSDKCIFEIYSRQWRRTHYIEHCDDTIIIHLYKDASVVSIADPTLIDQIDNWCQRINESHDALLPNGWSLRANKTQTNT